MHGMHCGIENKWADDVSILDDLKDGTVSRDYGTSFYIYN